MRVQVLPGGCNGRLAGLGQPDATAADLFDDEVTGGEDAVAHLLERLERPFGGPDRHSSERGALPPIVDTLEEVDRVGEQVPLDLADDRRPVRAQVEAVTGRRRPGDLDELVVDVCGTTATHRFCTARNCSSLPMTNVGGRFRN